MIIISIRLGESFFYSKVLLTLLPDLNKLYNDYIAMVLLYNKLLIYYANKVLKNAIKKVIKG